MSTPCSECHGSSRIALSDLIRDRIVGYKCADCGAVFPRISGNMTCVYAYERYMTQDGPQEIRIERNRHGFRFIHDELRGPGTYTKSNFDGLDALQIIIGIGDWNVPACVVCRILCDFNRNCETHGIRH